MFMKVIIKLSNNHKDKRQKVYQVQRNKVLQEFKFHNSKENFSRHQNPFWLQSR